MNIIVAGAGIVGVSCAIWLQRAGHDVTIVDRTGPASGTSHGNAGVLAAGAVIPVTTPGLIRKAPGMLWNRDAPLFLRWSYLPRLLPFLRHYLGHATQVHVDHYAAAIAERFDGFLSTGRRFSFLIGHPWILRNGLRMAVGTDTLANITLQVMGNLVDGDTPGAAGRIFRLTEKTLAVADPLLRRSRAAA